MVLVIIHTLGPISKGLDHSHFACLCLPASMLYACFSLSSSRLCHIWCPPRAWPCVVISDAHKALFGYWVAPCISFPFFCSVWWYAYHDCLCHLLAFFASLHACLHVHAWVLLASVSSVLQHNETIDIQSKPTFVPHEQPLLFALLFVCLFACLLVILPVCLLTCLLASLFLCLPCLSCLFTLCLFI